MGVGGSLEQRVDQRVVHDRETGVVPRHQLFDLNVEKGREDLTDLEQPMEAAIVPAVCARRVGVGIIARQLEQLVGKVQLLRRRLAPGQVQLQSAGAQLVVRRGELGVQGGQFIATEVGQGHGRCSDRVKIWAIGESIDPAIAEAPFQPSGNPRWRCGSRLKGALSRIDPREQCQARTPTTALWGASSACGADSVASPIWSSDSIAKGNSILASSSLKLATMIICPRSTSSQPRR